MAVMDGSFQLSVTYFAIREKSLEPPPNHIVPSAAQNSPEQRLGMDTLHTKNVPSKGNPQRVEADDWLVSRRALKALSTRSLLVLIFQHSHSICICVQQWQVKYVLAFCIATGVMTTKKWE